MVQPINGGGHHGHGHYARQVSRAAWREEMLNEILQKVRAATPAVLPRETPDAVRPPVKGALLDRYI